MTSYIGRRVLYMVFTMVAVSMVGFAIIKLPPGDYLTFHLQQLQLSGTTMSEAQLEGLRKLYGLDQPDYIQYVKWVTNFLQGNLGMSHQWNKPVTELIGERIGLTVLLAVITLAATYAMAIPIGIYSATHQYSVGDYTATVFGFIGLATPNFLLALILMWFSYSVLDFSITGLFSSEYLDAPWSFAKVFDMMKHLPVAIFVVATAGTAGLIRVMRSSLLDELQKQYVITARSKGVEEGQLLFKYPVRIAINPIVSTVGGLLPEIVSGTIITAIVLNLPTVGPLLFTALTAEDMQLASSIVMVLAFLTVIGTFISDMLLLWIDPRIRFEQEQAA